MLHVSPPRFHRMLPINNTYRETVLQVYEVLCMKQSTDDQWMYEIETTPSFLWYCLEFQRFSEKLFKGLRLGLFNAFFHRFGISIGCLQESDDRRYSTAPCQSQSIWLSFFSIWCFQLMNVFVYPKCMKTPTSVTVWISLFWLLRLFL